MMSEDQADAGDLAEAYARRFPQWGCRIHAHADAPMHAHQEHMGDRTRQRRWLRTGAETGPVVQGACPDENRVQEDDQWVVTGGDGTPGSRIESTGANTEDTV